MKVNSSQTRPAQSATSPGVTRKKPAIKGTRQSNARLLRAEKKEISKLAIEIRDRMVEGLRTPRGIRPEFDLTKLNEAVRIFSQIDTNSADDSTFEDKALFSISTNGETPLYDAIKVLISGLKRVREVESFNDKEIEAAYKTLFMSAPEHPSGTPGQLLVTSIHEVANERKKTTDKVKRYMPQFQALDKFLQALQAITKNKRN